MKRPFGVTIVAIIVFLNGLGSLASGIFGLVGGGLGSTPSIVALVLGIVTLAVAFGLFSGSKLARALTAIVLVLHVAAAVYAVVTLGFGAGTLLVQPIASGVLSLIGLGFLFSKPANAYFS